MSYKRQKISGAIHKMLKLARVARLATLDAKSRPHIVPVCFAYDGNLFYTAVDQNRSVLHENDSHVCETSGQYPAWRF